MFDRFTTSSDDTSTNLLEISLHQNKPNKPQTIDIVVFGSPESKLENKIQQRNFLVHERN
jgi:hypothetical protein